MQVQAQYCEQKTVRYRNKSRKINTRTPQKTVNISYEVTQQFLTYSINFLGFVAIFILPLDYIIKLHINEVRSWGTPGKIPQQVSPPVELKVEPIKQGKEKIKKSTTKTKQSRKRMKKAA